MYVDYELECQFEDAKNNILAWGVSTRNNNGEYKNFGVSGEVIRSGSGLYEQMEAGNVQYYNKFSLKLLEDAYIRFLLPNLILGRGDLL